MFNNANNLPFVSEKELIKQLPIPRSTFQSFKNEWAAKGRCLTEMGMFHIEGSGMNYWNPQKLFQWLLDYRIKQPGVFDYEKKKNEDAKQIILTLRRKGIKTNGK